MQIFPYGTVLKVGRDDTIEEIRRQLDSIHELGLNTVVVWPPVFRWESRELPGYPFATGRALLEHAERVGLDIVMELAGQIPSLEYAPSFSMKPEFRAMNRDGTPRELARPYDFINYNHPEVKDLIEGYLREVVLAYRGYPALVAYDIWNETMFASYDRYTLSLFREWLLAKYGTIEDLNDAWEGSFTDWNQVEFSDWIWASIMPVVDFNQFRKQNVAMVLRGWRAVIRELDPERPCIADNIHSMVTADNHYERPQDDWAVAREVDLFGISFYPKNHLPEMDASQRWEIFEATRAAKRGGQFWVSEMQSHNQSMFNPFNIVSPHDLRWWNWEAVSHGAKGIIYWKWRPFTRGLQTSARGLVDSSGARTPRAEEAERIGRIIERRRELFSKAVPRRSRAALLYDSLNHNFVKALIRNYEPFLPGSLYTDSVAGLFRAFWERNIDLDIVTPEDLRGPHIGEYRVLFVTNQVTIDGKLSEALVVFASGGGTVIYDGKFGLIDERGRLHSSLPGGPMNGRLGYRSTDIDPEGLGIDVEDSEWGRLTLTGHHEREIIGRLDPGAKVAARYADGLPAILRMRCGDGELIGILTFLWYGYQCSGDPRTLGLVDRLDEVYGLSLECVGVTGLKTKVIAVEGSMLLFVFNYSQSHVESTVRVFSVPWTVCTVSAL
ncbi:MAG TPA: beta-galactosidase, partial [Spirochaetia bacterium]|nr:beta-galactosidase [Spirochaetia bacterium]